MIIRRRRVDTLGVSQWAVVTAILAAATGMLAVQVSMFSPK